MTTIQNPQERPSDALRDHYHEVMDIIRLYPVSQVGVFGSTSHNDDVVGSDLDLLIKPDPILNLTMFHIGGLKMKLETLLNVPVDVLTIDAIHKSFRDRVIQEEVSIESFGDE